MLQRGNFTLLRLRLLLRILWLLLILVVLGAILLASSLLAHSCTSLWNCGPLVLRLGTFCLRIFILSFLRALHGCRCNLLGFFLFLFLHLFASCILAGLRILLRNFMLLRLLALAPLILLACGFCACLCAVLPGSGLILLRLLFLLLAVLLLVLLVFLLILLCRALAGFFLWRFGCAFSRLYLCSFLVLLLGCRLYLLTASFTFLRLRLLLRILWFCLMLIISFCGECDLLLLFPGLLIFPCILLSVVFASSNFMKVCSGCSSLIFIHCSL